MWRQISSKMGDGRSEIGKLGFSNAKWGRKKIQKAFCTDGEGDGGIIVRAGDMAAGVDHDHEGQADDNPGEGALGKDGMADGLDEEESPDEFDDEFVHELS